MRTPKHTPGPWVGYISPDDGRHIISEAHNQDVIVCEQVHTDADMGLIAAAPAMYEALQQSLVLVELAALEEWGREVTGEHQPPTTEARDRLEKVKAALAQAGDKP